MSVHGEAMLDMRSGVFQLISPAGNSGLQTSQFCNDELRQIKSQFYIKDAITPVCRRLDCITVSQTGQRPGSATKI